ncbi:MAG: hypothetical protein JST16_04945 [Bdellovibrionales bacterium]|nr:hypothetical protein [Bdellovibrionales bacterium]
MAKNKAVDSVGKMVTILTPLSSEDRNRVIHAALMLLGGKPFEIQDGQRSVDGAAGGDKTKFASLPARAQTWAKQNNLASDELQQVFHIDGETAEVISSEISGKNTAEKTIKAYLLTGLANLLSTGTPTFTDKAARTLCESLGCYDNTNHGKYLKKKGNLITGTKQKGWTITAPGLKRGAALVKELGADRA